MTNAPLQAPSPAAQSTRMAFYASLVVTIALIHYCLYRPFVAAPLPRIGNVVELDPLALSTYEDALDRERPTLVLIGDSHQLFFSVDERNTMEGVKRSGGDMILDDLARRIDGEHAPHAHTYARFATPGFKQFEELARFGVLLARSKHTPKVAIVSTRWEMFITATLLHDELDATPMQTYPDATRAWISELESAPIAASPAVLEAARDLLRPPTVALTADAVDGRVGKWLGSYNLLERNRRLQWYFTYQYQRVEAPLQQALFGTIEQMGPQVSPVVGDARLRDFNIDSFTALLRMLHARGITLFCYLAPHNPDAPGRDLLDWAPDITRRVKEAAAEVGCPMLDLSRAIPAGPEYWGFAGGDRDPVHMKPPGIALTGRLLFDEGARLGIWPVLDRQ